MRREVRWHPAVGRYSPGSRPDRLERGQARWIRFPNANGGSVSVHPDDTAHWIEHGLDFEDGRHAIVIEVERDSYVDVMNFHFVDREDVDAYAYEARAS
jgi:hypothetical protein